jgi:hypothetical protein
VLSPVLVGRLASISAAAREDGFSAPGDQAIRVTSERFVVASADTLRADEGEALRATSAAEAHDRRSAAGGAARDLTVVGSHEAR